MQTNTRPYYVRSDFISAFSRGRATKTETHLVCALAADSFIFQKTKLEALQDQRVKKQPDRCLQSAPRTKIPSPSKSILISAGVISFDVAGNFWGRLGPRNCSGKRFYPHILCSAKCKG